MKICRFKSFFELDGRTRLILLYISFQLCNPLTMENFTDPHRLFISMMVNDNN